MAPVCGQRRASPSTPLGQAEVGDVRVAVGVEQDVGRLEVAVQDAALVGVVDRPGDGRQQAAAASRAGRRARPDASGQAAALDQLHAEVVLALVLADLVDRDDVGWSRPAAASASLRKRCTSVVGRPAAPARIIFRATTRLRLTLPRLVDDAHAAAADLVEQLVVAEERFGGQIESRRV